VRHRRWPTLILLICGVWLIGLGLYFMLLRPPLLPEDLRYMGRTLAEVDAAAPELAPWLRRVFTVMGGFMSATGVLTGFVVMNTPPRGRRATGVVLAVVGLLSVATMSATNFAIQSDFKWLLLVPAVLWAIGVAACFQPGFSDQGEDRGNDDEGQNGRGQHSADHRRSDATHHL
jgi:hypothetical protein